MSRIPPKGRGSPPVPRPKAAPGGKGSAKDTVATVRIVAAPKGTGRMLGILLKGYVMQGMETSEDGTTRRFSLERRKARELHHKIRKMWNSEQVEVRFAQNGNDITAAVEAEPAPTPIAAGEDTMSKTQRSAQRAAAAAAERNTAQGGLPPMAPSATGIPKPPPPQPQEWGWKHSALDHPPAPAAAPAEGGMAGFDYSQVEGVEGIKSWPFASWYRPVDADKLEAQSRRRLQIRDGKQKITLGVNSDRSYLVEPDRDHGGWKACRMRPEGPREVLGRGESFREAVLVIKDFEEKAALADAAPAPAKPSAPPKPVTAAPVPPRTVTSGPAVAPTVAPAALPTQTAPAAAPPGPTLPAAPFAMCLLAPGNASAPTRWAVLRGEEIMAVGDELEDVLQRAYVKVGAETIVLGWRGVVPQRARVHLPQETMIELDLSGPGLELNAGEAERIRKVLESGGEPDAGEPDAGEPDAGDAQRRAALASDLRKLGQRFLNDEDDEDEDDEDDLASGGLDEDELAGGSPAPAPRG